VDADRILVKQAAAGDAGAFDELVNRHRARIYRLVRVMTGGDSESEDLVQETFVRAYRMLTKFRGDSSFGTWLHRIAVNVIKSYLSRRGRHLDRVGRTLEPGGQTPIEAFPSSQNLEADVARRIIIDRALSELPEGLRLLLTLRDLQGMEYQDIARVTGLKMGTVASGVFRARQRIRPLLVPLIGPERP
jgi:RNA polymerase sigma-70 factor (ECF subfamily)